MPKYMHPANAHPCSHSSRPDNDVHEKIGHEERHKDLEMGKGDKEMIKLDREENKMRK